MKSVTIKTVQTYEDGESAIELLCLRAFIINVSVSIAIVIAGGLFYFSDFDTEIKLLISMFSFFLGMGYFTLFIAHLSRLKKKLRLAGPDKLPVVFEFNENEIVKKGKNCRAAVSLKEVRFVKYSHHLLLFADKKGQFFYLSDETMKEADFQVIREILDAGKIKNNLK